MPSDPANCCAAWIACAPVCAKSQACCAYDPTRPSADATDPRLKLEERLVDPAPDDDDVRDGCVVGGVLRVGGRPDAVALVAAPLVVDLGAVPVPLRDDAVVELRGAVLLLDGRALLVLRAALLDDDERVVVGVLASPKSLSNSKNPIRVLGLPLVRSGGVGGTMDVNRKHRLCVNVRRSVYLVRFVLSRLSFA
jgi:hypothetical protein